MIDTAKEINGWTGTMLITFIAVLSCFLVYRLVLFIHKDKIKENDNLRQQLKQNKIALGKCRQENKELKSEILTYLIKSATTQNNKKY